jgi:uncharacterized protein YdcH (DUF465 family)
MKTQLLPIFLLLAILLSVIPLQVFGEEQVARPAIRIMELKNPLVGNYPIRIYVYPGVYVSENEASLESRECREVFTAMHDAIRDLHHIIVRFIDEHPEYYQLILIRFANASDEATADITVKIFKKFGPESANASGYILYGENRPLRIGLLCNANIGYNGYYTTFMHELFHALGVDHAKQPFTDGGEWDLMSPAGPLDIKIYPSTLDLYALYLVHFKGVVGGVVTLPNGMPYTQVKPYAEEVQSLMKENARLKDQINTLNALYDKVRRERDTLRGLLGKANGTIRRLNEQYQTIRSILDSYIRAYNSLQQRYENLRGNCTLLLNVCNQTYHELTAKLSEKHVALLNITQRYNQCAAQFNRLYEDYQALSKDYDDLAGRFNIFISIALAGVAALGLFAIRVSVKYDKLADEYNELVEELERLEEGRRNE